MSLEVHDVSVRIGAAQLLRGVSLKVAAGQVVAVLGPNGAGKSTLLRVISGDLHPSGGAVKLDQRPLAAWSAKELAKRRALLPQESILNFPFTALEVTLMGRTPHIRGIESARDFGIAREALKAVEMDHLETRLYTTLSGGERQRVQLARVLAQIWESPETHNDHARYLLLDEPTNSLDLAHQHSILIVARRFADQGLGVLVILHDLNLAAQYADQIMILKQGAVQAYGSPRQVLTAALIQESFGIPVSVIDHPTIGCPLIVSTAQPAQVMTNV